MYRAYVRQECLNAEKSSSVADSAMEYLFERRLLAVILKECSLAT